MRISHQQKSLLSACAVTVSLATSAQSVLADSDPFQGNDNSDAAASPPNGAVSSDTLIYDRARSEMNKGDAGGAVNDLNSLLEKYPNKPIYLKERARAFYKLKDYPKAMSDINAALNSEQKNAWALDFRGLIKMRSGDFDGAVEDATAAIALEKRPKYAAPYYFNRAYVHQKQNKDRAAIEDFSVAISMNPSYAAAYASRAYAERRLKEEDKAMADYNKALELDPKDTMALVNRSNIKFARSDYKDSLTDLNKALAIKPTDVIALRNRGKTKDALGDSNGAIADYNEALRLNGANPQTEKAQAALSPSTNSAPAGYGDKKNADIARYMAMLQPWIKSFWSAPRSTSSKRTVIRFSTDSSGEVSDVKVQQSSGDPAFDDAGVKAVEQAAPIPAPPAFLKPPVPIEFRFDYNVHQH